MGFNQNRFLVILALFCSIFVLIEIQVESANIFPILAFSYENNNFECLYQKFALMLIFTWSGWDGEYLKKRKFISLFCFEGAAITELEFEREKSSLKNETSNKNFVFEHALMLTIGLTINLFYLSQGFNSMILMMIFKEQ